MHCFPRATLMAIPFNDFSGNFDKRTTWLRTSKARRKREPVVMKILCVEVLPKVLVLYDFHVWLSGYDQLAIVWWNECFYWRQQRAMHVRPVSSVNSILVMMFVDLICSEFNWAFRNLFSAIKSDCLFEQFIALCIEKSFHRLVFAFCLNFPALELVNNLFYFNNIVVYGWISSDFKRALFPAMSRRQFIEFSSGLLLTRVFRHLWQLFGLFF